jgi:hypothetical protein
MKKAALVGIVIGCALAVSFAYASIPDGNGVINACRDTRYGYVRIIDTATTPSCASGEAAVSWSQNGSAGVTGLQRFSSDAAFTVPPGVTRVLAELVGGGGGGGVASGCTGGGGGGAGALHALLAVTPGTVLNMTIGLGGVAGAAGGTTTLTFTGGNTLQGLGGGAGAAPGNPPSIGGGGAGGATSSVGSGVLGTDLRGGESGTDGICASPGTAAPPSPGGIASGFSKSGGDGGTVGAFVAKSGRNGVVVLRW